MNTTYLEYPPPDCRACGYTTEYQWSYCPMCGRHIASGVAPRLAMDAELSYDAHYLHSGGG